MAKSWSIKWLIKMMKKEACRTASGASTKNPEGA